MGQLTVYIDDGFLKKIELAAKREHKSISKWVKNRLLMTLSNRWPDNYFELFGSLKGINFQRPKQPAFKNDVKRANL